MKTLFGHFAPENQKEFCFFCINRLDDCCPCDSYNKLPENEKFDLVDLEIDLNGDLSDKYNKK